MTAARNAQRVPGGLLHPMVGALRVPAAKARAARYPRINRRDLLLLGIEHADPVHRGVDVARRRCTLLGGSENPVPDRHRADVVSRDRLADRLGEDGILGQSRLELLGGQAEYRPVLVRELVRLHVVAGPGELPLEPHFSSGKFDPQALHLVPRLSVALDNRLLDGLQAGERAALRPGIGDPRGLLRGMLDAQAPERFERFRQGLEPGRFQTVKPRGGVRHTGVLDRQILHDL